MERSRPVKIVYYLVSLAVLAAAVFFVYRIVYAGILTLPYPRELLEASNVAVTNEFVAGQSPYTVASLSRKVPGANYDYPVLNSLLAAAIVKITGCGTVSAHFVISLASILLSGSIGFILVRKKAQTVISPPLAALLFMFCHWRFGYISAAPDDLGLLLMLVTTCLAVSPKIGNKSLLCAFGITLCFYTKQYFVFVAPGLFIYMFLYSRKDAIKLFAWTLVINTAVFVVIMLNWPLYFIKTFWFTYLGTVVGGGVGRLANVMEQFRYLAVAFVALFAAIIIAAVMGLRKLYRSNRRLQDIKVTENDIYALSCVQSVIMIVPLLVIGRNDGAFISYFLQLWMPYIVIAALLSIDKMKPEKHEFIYIGIYAAAAAVTVYLGFGKLPLHTLTPEEVANWQKAIEYTEIYGQSGEVYFSRCLAYEYFAGGNGDCFCGHDSEVDENTEKKLSEAGFDVSENTYLDQLVDQNLMYRAEITKKAEDHVYSLITLDNSDSFSMFDEEDVIRCGYKCIDTLPLQLGNMPYEVSFYIF